MSNMGLGVGGVEKYSLDDKILLSEEGRYWNTLSRQQQQLPWAAWGVCWRLTESGPKGGLLQPAFSGPHSGFPVNSAGAGSVLCTQTTDNKSQMENNPQRKISKWNFYWTRARRFTVPVPPSQSITCRESMNPSKSYSSSYRTRISFRSLPPKTLSSNNFLYPGYFAVCSQALFRASIIPCTWDHLCPLTH